MTDGTDGAAHDFVRFRDPNEALGLAVRLVAARPPFDRLPLGLSAGMLTGLVDRGSYGFARQGSTATGFAAWSFVPEEVAEAYLREQRAVRPEEMGSGTAGVVFVLTSIDRPTTAFLVERLRNLVFAQASALYFIRDYGPAGRSPRLVRMRRTMPRP